MNKEAQARIEECRRTKSEVLDLSHLELKEIPAAIGELIWLKKLNLDNNQIQSIQGLEQLHNLSALFLDNNQIQSIQGLEQLHNLANLSLSNNKIQSTQGLEQLHNLDYLLLSNNQIQSIQGLEQLHNLAYLYLDNNQIQSTQGLEQLHNLATLSLSNNKIQSTQGLEQLHNLANLLLSNNQIQSIQGLEQLHNLAYLYLDNNQIQSTQGLDQLHNLATLSLSNNKIQSTQGLEQLHNLANLSLSNNKIQSTQGLEQLHNLAILFLDNNQIQSIQGLEQLDKLQLLNLEGNNIQDLYFTEQCSNLSTLPVFWKEQEELRYRFLHAKEQREAYLEKNKGIYLHNCNQLVEPSPAWVKLGKAAVQDYFQAIREQGKVTLREAKLMLVGRPNMGKTTLSGKLRDLQAPLPPSTASTRGIDVDDWEYVYEGENYTIRIWDFGGQDIQYSLHQFFMTERAIYGLLDSTREFHDQASGGDLYANYWLQTIEKLAQGSPTFHIYNHYQGQQKNTSIHGSLCRQYDFLKQTPIVVDLFNVHQDLEEQKNLELLQCKIQKEVAALPNVGLVLPKKWAAVRQALLEKAKEIPIITFAAYRKICQQHGIQDKQVMLLISSYLHEVGSIIHYNTDKTSSLYKLLILRRSWATEAVYKVALSTLVTNKGGIFERQDLEKIWQAGEDLSAEDAESYQGHLHELLELLQKFEVCYPYGKQYLVPQLVRPECPDNLPSAAENAIKLEYKYEFMPYGLLYRLAVRLNTYIEEQQIWRRGMVLTHLEQGNKGWIVLTEERRQQQGSIYLLINGDKAARYFLQKQIEQELKKLHTIYNISKQVALLVPCICSNCKLSKKPKQFQYQEQLLSKLKAKKKPVIECQGSWDEVNILQLIDHAFMNRPEEVENIIKDDKNTIHNYFYGEINQAETMEIHKSTNSNNTANENSNVQLVGENLGGL